MRIKRFSHDKVADHSVHPYEADWSAKSQGKEDSFFWLEKLKFNFVDDDNYLHPIHKQEPHNLSFFKRMKIKFNHTIWRKVQKDNNFKFTVAHGTLGSQVM